MTGPPLEPEELDSQGEEQDLVLEAVSRVLEGQGWVGLPTAACLVYEWVDPEGQGAIGIMSSIGIRDATMLGLLTWARAHVVDTMLGQEDIGE